MDTNFDLDVNNYNISDLLNFFNLPDIYSIELVEQKANEMSEKIQMINKSKFDSKHKFDIINFIKLAKDILISAYYDIQNENELIKNEKREMDFAPMNSLGAHLGKIINPLGIHPALQDTTILPNNITGYNHNEIIAVYTFNTVTRENFFNTPSTNCMFNLPIKLKNVHSLSLASIQIPNVFFTFSAERGTNQLFIYENVTNLSGIVKLPDGNYTNTPTLPPGTPTTSIGTALEIAINEQILGITNSANFRFKVNVNPVNNFTTISNTTNTFSMKTITNNSPLEENDFCSPYVFPSQNIDDKQSKSKLKPSEFTCTLGYLLGFRNTSYSGELSYTSESTFNGIYSSYLYFALNDYTGSQQVSITYGVLQNSLIDDDVLAVIPFNGTDTYSYIYGNDSDLIYKRRNYFGPVDISRISIKLLNPFGNILNLLQNDFSFSLTITSNYNLKKSQVPKVIPVV
jgi:hypothetical protein